MQKDALSSYNDPKMLELLKKINQLKEEISSTEDEKTQAALKKELFDVQMHYNILSERRGN